MEWLKKNAWLAVALVGFAVIAGQCPGPGPQPPPGPPPEPTGQAQLILLRPWSCNLQESDADLTIRESIDAVDHTDTVYIREFQGAINQRLERHAEMAAYEGLWPDKSKPYIWHVVPTKDGVQIVHQGQLRDAKTVLDWIDVPVYKPSRERLLKVREWLDVQFDRLKDKLHLLGSLSMTEDEKEYMAGLPNITSLPGFKPIPKYEWDDWERRFPVERRADSVRHVMDQEMSSCVGCSGANCVEEATYQQLGDWGFRPLSGVQLYQRIGRSANSGAYVPDAQKELTARGVLPALGSVGINGQPYAHTHRVNGGFYDRPEAGWESTAQGWRVVGYKVTDEESAFRLIMDIRFCTQFGRSRHALAGICYDDGWWYHNTWGINWGAYDKGFGKDRLFYDSITMRPCLRDEVAILVNRR